MNLLTRLADFAVAHGFDAAGVFFGFGVLAFCAFGGGAADFFFYLHGRFLDVGGAEAAEVVRGLEADVPGVAVHVAQRLHVGRLDPEVHRLALVDPLLAARGGVDDPFIIDVEGGEILCLEVGGDAVDVLQFAVEILEVVDHFLVP